MQGLKKPQWIYASGIAKDSGWQTGSDVLTPLGKPAEPSYPTILSCVFEPGCHEYHLNSLIPTQDSQLACLKLWPSMCDMHTVAEANCSVFARPLSIDILSSDATLTETWHGPFYQTSRPFGPCDTFLVGGHLLKHLRPLDPKRGCCYRDLDSV